MSDFLVLSLSIVLEEIWDLRPSSTAFILSMPGRTWDSDSPLCSSGYTSFSLQLLERSIDVIFCFSFPSLVRTWSRVLLRFLRDWRLIATVLAFFLSVEIDFMPCMRSRKSLILSSWSTILLLRKFSFTRTRSLFSQWTWPIDDFLVWSVAESWILLF